MKRNIIKYYFKSCSYNCATLLLTGTVIQAFLLQYGVSENSVSFFVSALQIVQVIIMIFGSGYIERISNITKSMFVLNALHFCLPIVLIFLCLFNNLPVNFAFATVFLTGILENIFRGISTVLDYKLPFHIIDMKNYGKVVGNSCAIYGIFGAILSAVMTLITKKHEYFSAMSVFFMLALILEIISCISIKSMKAVQQEEEHSTENKKKIFILKYKPFYTLIIPNLFRGICAGVYSVAAIIGHYFNILTAAEAAILVTLMQIATIIGSYFYSFLSVKIRDSSIIMWSGIAVAVFMSVMTVGNSKPIFLCAYFLAGIAINFVNCSVPVAVTKFVDYNYIGQYSAWRMMLHTLGTAIGSGVTVLMLNACGGVLTMVISGLMQVISSISYYIILKRSKLR